MIELTEYHIKWMHENYGKVSRKKCAQYFHVSTTTIDRWAKLLDLRKRHNQNIGIDEQDTTEHEDIPIGYCMDCEHYIAGGHCENTGRSTGALNEKRCFKSKEL